MTSDALALARDGDPAATTGGRRAVALHCGPWRSRRCRLRQAPRRSRTYWGRAGPGERSRGEHDGCSGPHFERKCVSVRQLFAAKRRDFGVFRGRGRGFAGWRPEDRRLLRAPSFGGNELARTVEDPPGGSDMKISRIAYTGPRCWRVTRPLCFRAVCGSLGGG